MELFVYTYTFTECVSIVKDQESWNFQSDQSYFGDKL